ncbi:MAG: hypothetical protein HC843_04365 [Sphingomonadales bacterium]|nr:hypothetical protein [Sphingomonadales bacterium]
MQQGMILCSGLSMPSTHEPINQSHKIWLLNRAFDDCHFAKKDPTKCPAIDLLNGYPGRGNSPAKIAALEAQCQKKIKEIKRKFYLEKLASMDILFNRKVRVKFHLEARKVLTGIADYLHIPDQDWNLKHEEGRAGDPGKIFLIADNYSVEITARKAKGANVVIRANTHHRIEDSYIVLYATHREICNTLQFAKTLQQLLPTLKSLSQKRSSPEGQPHDEQTDKTLEFGQL